VIVGDEREVRMKWMQDSLSIAFVLEGPPLPPAPAHPKQLAAIPQGAQIEEGEGRTSAPNNPIRACLL